MTEQERVKVWAEWMSRMSEPTTLLKVQMRAVVNSYDDGILPLSPANKLLTPAAILGLFSSTQPALTQASKELLVKLIIAVQVPPPPPRRARLFRDIRTDLVALTNPQLVAVWSAFTAGNPPLYQLSSGPNSASLALGQFLGQVVAFTAAEQKEFKVRAVVIYLLDNPTWLVNPVFDATINISGDEIAV